MLLDYKRGQGSIVLRVKILDSSVSTGAGKTGLAFGTSGLRIATIADNEATTTGYTAAGGTIETVTTLGTFAAPTATKCRFKEVDATSHPGVYELQLDDTRFAVTSAKSLLISISGASNAADCDVVIPLRDINPYDSVRAGLTALPAAAAEAAGGLFTRGTGAGQINQPANGEIDANVVALNGSAFSTPYISGAGGVQLADGVDHGGTTARVRLGSTDATPPFYVTSSGAAPAVRFERTGSINDASGALSLVGYGLGAGFRIQGGSKAFDILCDGLGLDADINGDVIGDVTGDLVGRVVGDSATIFVGVGVQPDLTQTNGVEMGYTLKQVLRLIAAAVAGKSSGGPGSPVFRSLDDSANRITGVADDSGNRTTATHSA